MRRSKYNFASARVGDEMTVAGIDIYSMQNSLRGFNSRNKTSLKFEQASGPDASGNYIYKRTA
jgi:hypothetical protein